jgi:hypothetical protein
MVAFYVEINRSRESSRREEMKIAQGEARRNPGNAFQPRGPAP